MSEMRQAMGYRESESMNKVKSRQIFEWISFFIVVMILITILIFIAKTQASNIPQNITGVING